MSEDVFQIVGTVQEAAFRVEQVVAEGGFAVVYRAHHQSFRADVALKCLKIPGSLEGELRDKFLEKFREEAQLLFQLSAVTPAVVRPLHVGTIQSATRRFIPFIALEWLNGESLDGFIVRRRAQDKPPLSIERAIRLLAPAAHALELAHHLPGPNGTRLAILHRDLKPENLFLATIHGKEQLKILDFGIGKVKAVATQIAGRLSAHETGLSAFTPAYGAPEQWLPKRYGQTGPWTDVWGLALTFMEVILGRPALDGDAHAIMGSVINERERPTPRALGLPTSDAIEQVFRKALAVDPRERLQEVRHFWDALEQAAGVSVTRVDGIALLESLRPLAGPSEPPQPVPVSHVPDLLPDPPVSKPFRHERATALETDSSSRKRPVSRGVNPAPDPFDTAFGELSLGSNYEHAEQANPATHLSGVGIMPGVDSTPRIRPPRSLRASLAPRFHGRALFEQARQPLYLLTIAVMIMLLDFAYQAYVGDAFALGPVRAVWIAGPLAVIALITLVSRLFFGES